ncbi:hypothetical protein D3C77_558270 [compost metagenome]
MAMSRSFGLAWLMSSPSTRISPPVMFSSPAMQFIRVDLPQPDGPTKIRNSPASIFSAMFFSVSTLALP